MWLILLFAPGAPAAILDGFQQDIRNAAEFRRRLGIGDHYIFVGGSNVTVTSASTGTNMTVTISVPTGAGGSNFFTITGGGITNLNGSTNASQTFATGTGGADFNIATAAGVHTFHLPTAGAGARGALSSADWTTFNSKQAGDADLTALAGISGVQGDVIYHDGANWTRLAASTSGFKLETRGAGMNPVWDTDETGGAGTPGGAFPMLQFHDTGGVFAGTTNLTWDATNSRVKLAFALRYTSGEGRLNISNIVVGTPALLLAGTGFGTENWLALDDTGLQNSRGRSINISFDADNSSPPNDIASSGNGWVFTNDAVTGGVNLYPNVNQFSDLGYSAFRMRTNWMMSADLANALTLRDSTTINSGRGTIFKHPDDWKVTNRFSFSITNAVAGQVLKINSVSISAGLATITLTNDTDLTGGAGSSLLTNLIEYASSAGATNQTVVQIAASGGALSSWLNSSLALLTEFNSNGFFMQTNGLTNYSLGNTRSAPANTIAQGVGARQGGMDAPAWTDDRGRTFDTDMAIYNNEVYYAAPGSGTTVFTHGAAGATTGGTTVSHEAPDERKPYMTKLDSAATSNSVSGFDLNVNLWNAGAHNGSSRVGGGFFFSRWMTTNHLGIVPLNVISATRIYVGLANAAEPNLTNIVNTTNATGEYLGLMADPRQSATMFFTCRDAVAEFRTNTTIAIVATNFYEVAIEKAHTNRFVRATVRDLSARLEWSGTWSNNISTNFMKPVILCKNGTNRANSIYFSKLYVQPSQSPRWN